MIFGEIGEECGVIGVHAPGRAVSELLEEGLVALQHRGQDSAGLAVERGDEIASHRGLGLVAEVFTPAAYLPGHLGIGHVRYSTSGGVAPENSQPVCATLADGTRFALAHNGNLTNLDGPGHPSATDTYRLAAYLGGFRGPLGDALATALHAVDGAYSLVAMAAGTLYAARDPHGFRPLCVGRLGMDGWVVASETAALDSVGAVRIRDIEPGEIVELGAGGLRSRRFSAAEHTLCAFEYVYFARQDSLVDGDAVYEVRRRLGAALAEEAPADADLVIPVPDTARPAALGYAEASGIRFGEGLARNQYVSRTFIRATADARVQGVRRKLNPIVATVSGRRLVVVDDSIVRATSITQVVTMLRQAGAAEIHIRVASPPVHWPCYFGVDIRSREELIANRFDAAELAAVVGADSLAYLSTSALASCAPATAGLCTGCFTGEYPVRTVREMAVQ